MPVIRNDGIVYRYPDNPADIRLNGVSVVNLLVEEAFVGPEGWGYVLTRKELGEADKPIKKWVDGQVRNHTYWGKVEATLN